MKISKNVRFAEQINKRDWWHCPPEDKKAYKARGVFLASSFKECEFYGRPLDKPLKVHVTNPLIGTEENIIKKLFGNNSKQMGASKSLINRTAKQILKVRFQLDKEMCKAARNQGYDAIAVVTQKGLEKVREGKLPRSVELNVLHEEKVLK
jgi:hypothetical protein